MEKKLWCFGSVIDFFVSILTECFVLFKKQKVTCHVRCISRTWCEIKINRCNEEGREKLHDECNEDEKYVDETTNCNKNCFKIYASF